MFGPIEYGRYSTVPFPQLSFKKPGRVHVLSGGAQLPPKEAQAGLLTHEVPVERGPYAGAPDRGDAF